MVSFINDVPVFGNIQICALLIPKLVQSQRDACITILMTWSVFAVSGSGAFAHGGGTDSNGCHTNHKTGDYHCH
ncbi:YHYH domain-containing protein [Rhizobium leguminosarum]|uniref:YHYH domain-containing protein n=1 Tax=Rhizobium leguminosarum TaxID=384 RepID=UPI001C9231DF